jgi:hypothetical protein
MSESVVPKPPTLLDFPPAAPRLPLDAEKVPVRVGVIGCGYWGPKLVRNFTRSSGCEVAAIADCSPERLARIGESHPHIPGTTDYKALLVDPDIEVVAVVTSAPELAQRLRRLRDHGQAQRYHHAELGYNYRMDAIQGAVPEVKLGHLDRWNARRAELAQTYREALADMPGLRLPTCREQSESVHHLYVVRHQRRDALAGEMAARGITTGLHYPQPVHRQPGVTAGDAQTSDLPETDAVAASCLSLPMCPTLSDRQVRQVGDALAASLESI